VATKLGMAKETLTQLSRTSGAFYAVQEIDYPSGAVLNEQGAIDGALKKGTSANTKETLTVISDRRAPIGSCDGRDVSAMAKVFTIRLLLCVKGSRAYMATVVSPNSASTDDLAEASSFLASFSVTVPSTGTPVPVKLRDGQIGTVLTEDLQGALAQGAKIITAAEYAKAVQQTRQKPISTADSGYQFQMHEKKCLPVEP
jgi:hypothetical protein